VIHEVVIIDQAEMDMVDLFGYVARTDCIQAAEKVLCAIENACESLCEMPERGHVPAELDSVGIATFREIHFKPYRILYEIAQTKVFIHCVLDGRRDVQELLERRLLRE